MWCSTTWQIVEKSSTMERLFFSVSAAMIPEAHLISSDFSIYDDLIFVVALLCLGMTLCSAWLVFQKRSCRFQVAIWSGFFLLLVLGTLGLCHFIYAQRLIWRDTCAQLVASYANVVGRLDHWKIQPGNPEFFSDWSEPFVFSFDQPKLPPPSLEEELVAALQWTEPLQWTGPICEKLAIPESLSVGWLNNDPGFNSVPIHVQRRNQWAFAKLLECNAVPYDNKCVFAQWSPVPQATTYRLQWKGANSYDTNWITVYTGSAAFCYLQAPEGMSLAFRVRAEGGTPEDDTHFNQIIEILDFPAATNPFVGYAYTMRFVDRSDLSLSSESEQLQFIVSPISDANNNGFIDADEMPNDIGERFPITPLAQHIRERKERAMYFNEFNDQWGKWFSIAEPIWTPDNKMDGVIAMDFRVDAVYRAMFLERVYPHCLFVLVTVVYFGAVLFVNSILIKTATVSRLADELQNTVSALTVAKQEAETALQAKTLFLTNMSHEFRTPLNAILGFTEILVQSSFQCTADRQGLCAEAINQIKVSGKNLLELVNNLLGVAAMDGTRAPLLTLSSVHFRNLILEVVDMMRNRAEYKSLSLVVSEPKDVPERIVTDAPHLRQVLVLLIDNAVKFTHEGSVSINYGIVSGQQSMFYVSVSDTGIGIDAEYLNSIFKPFSQADATSTRQYGGAGIGLAVARQTAELLNGSISVESQLGEGSTFTFTFPGQVAEPEAFFPKEVT